MSAVEIDADGYVWSNGHCFAHITETGQIQQYRAIQQTEQQAIIDRINTNNLKAAGTPRARSLWLKEHRSTGPDKDQYEHRGQR